LPWKRKGSSEESRLPNSKQFEQAAQLHKLGPLPLAYFLAEIEAGADINETLSRFLKLTPLMVAGVGADRADATATAAAAALAYVPPRGNA
jgi:hypothetical protein